MATPGEISPAGGADGDSESVVRPALDGLQKKSFESAGIKMGGISKIHARVIYPQLQVN